MAQYDLLLTQNVHATLTEYSEKFVNVAKGGLISAIADQTPTVLAGGTDGYILSRDDAEVTGLNWVDPTSLGVSVANQANDRLVTATATADALNAEAQLTYNTSQGLLIGSGLGIVFTAAATTYQIYTPASAFTAGIAIITGTNSAAGAGDITLQAGAGVSAGGNVYFQRDTTYGNFYFGTGSAGQLPARSSEANVVFYDTSSGLLTYGPPDIGGYWTDQTTYLTPTTAAQSVRTDGTLTSGFFVSPTIQSGIEASGVAGSQVRCYASGVRVQEWLTGWMGMYVNIRMTAADASIELTDSAAGGDVYFEGGDSTTFQTDHVHYRSGNATNITATNSGNIYIYTGASTAGSRGQVYIGDGTVSSSPLLENASATHVVTVDTSTGLLNWTAVSDVGGDSPWSVAANVITPAVSGDNIRLASTEQLQFIDATQYIVGVTGYIDVYVGSVQSFRFATASGTHVTYADILAGGTGIDIGDTGSNPFNSVSSDRYYVAVIGTYIDVSGTDMTFTSVAAGTVNLADIGSGDGTVTSVGNGNGMNFTTFTTSGTITLGTPTTSLTSATTNAVTTSSHTHAITTGIALNNIVKCSTACVLNDYAKFSSTGLLGRTYAEVAADIDASYFAFSNNNNQTGGSLQFYDNVELEMGTGNDVSIYFSGSHLYFDSLLTTTDIFFRTGTTARFTFNMGTYTGTATDWIATSDVRAKTNIHPFELDMNKFLYLGSMAIRHNWREGWGPTDVSAIGFVAQSIEKFFPELVTIGSERPHLRGISYGKMVTVAIKATAQTWEYAVAIDGKLDVVRSEFEDLKIEVKKLKKQLNTLQNG